jgi:hypothetical protein
MMDKRKKRMKNYTQAFLGIFILMLFAGFIMPDKENGNNQRKGYGLGERFTYRVHFGFINAGEAVIEVSDKLHKVGDKVCYKANINGKSTGMFNMMMPIDDNWGAYMDVNSLLPLQSYRYLEEGRYRKYEVVDYKHEDEKAVIQLYHDPERDSLKEKKDFEIPFGVHNMVSGAFLMRTLNYDNYQEGDTIRVPGYLDEKVYNLEVLFEGFETIKTKAGKFEAVKLTPVMPDNKLFDGENSISFWFSDDEHRVPLKIKAEMFVGSVGIELTDMVLGKGIMSSQIEEMKE